MGDRIWKAEILIAMLLILDVGAHAVPPQTGCVQSSTSFWSNRSFATQTAQFTVTYDAIPSQAGMDGVIGFSASAATGYTSLAAIVRFAPNGIIDARNGGGYSADVAMSYVAGAPYRFRLVINPTTKRYSVYVTSPGSTEVALATNYAFRSEQATTSSFNNWGTTAESGTQTICNMTIGATPPAITTQPTSQTITVGQTATFSVSATGTTLGYQWRKNGADISGATSPSYTTPTTTTSDNGAQFSVVVSNSAGSATSNAATLTIDPPMVSTMSLSPARLIGGESSTGSVTLNGPAPSGGAVVTLSSDNAAATVPAGVTVLAGATTADFPVTTSAVGTLSSSFITGSYNGTQTATLTINPPELSTMSISAASVTGGASLTGTVTFNGPAPSGGAVVTLSSDNAAATVSADVTVAEGAATATFPINTIAVGTLTSATITGSYNGMQIATLSINPPALSTVSISAASVTGSDYLTGTVTLDGPAPSGGAVVTLSSDNAAATVPASVTVAEGATAADFPIDTIAVTTLTSVTISGSLNGTQTVMLSVVSLGCPCTIWPSTAVPAVIDSGPDASVELGVTFRADRNGYITGIRFYKSSGNTGVHVGNLWSGTGTRLATATFSGETASGWQQVNFSDPVAITANTAYVASYHTNTGHYSITGNYFATSGANRGPLHASANGSGTANGPYAYGSTSAFPSSTYKSTNYWVDVVFVPAVNPAPVAPVITTHPTDQTVAAGQAATFSVTATGTAPLAYQWRKNGANISGATSTTYTTAVTAASDNGAQFSVVVSNSAGSATSTAAILTVNARLLSANPTSLSFGNVNVGGNSLLTATLTNSGNSNVTVSNVSISGAGFNTSGVPTGQILMPGQTATLNVTFAPAGGGDATGNAVVSSNASNSPAIVSLSGTGIQLVSHAVTLSWNPSSSVVSGYHVYFGTVPGGPYTKLTPIPTATTTYRDTSVQPGRTYYYVVTAVGLSGEESVPSNEASAVIP